MRGPAGLLARALARAAGRHCALLPAAAMLLGAAGALAPAGSPAARPAPVAAALNQDVLQIDAVLAHRAPELGVALRQRISNAILEESRRARLDPLFVLGLIEVESEFDGAAVSYAGARGLMQLRPVTLEYLAELEGIRLSADELWRDPAMQVRLGVRYIARLERRFGSLDLALMAYNAGPEKLKMSLEAGDIDRFRNYVRAVRRNYARFRKGVPVYHDAALAQASMAGAGPAAPGR